MRTTTMVVAALIAATAMITATCAAAEAAEFHSSTENTTISGSQTNTNHLSNGTFDITCSTAIFEATQSGRTVSSWTVTPVYSGCHVVFLFTFSATINFHGCHYVIDADGNVALDCDGTGEKVTVQFAGCTMEFGEQTIEGAVAYSNNEAKSSITMNVNAWGIHFNQHGSTCGTGTSSGGSYTGYVALSGEEEGVPSEIWVE